MGTGSFRGTKLPEPAAIIKDLHLITVSKLVITSMWSSWTSILEVNSETDFVARNETFQEVARNIGNSSLLSDDIDSLNSLNISDD